MTLKEINFSVDMYGTSAITSSTYETAYTGDEDSVQLKFTVTDEPDITGATALIHLYFGDSSHVERVCKPITGGFEYTLTGTENDHAGVARTDIYITKGAAKYTRAGYKFRIDRSLEASAPLVEYAVDTVDTVVAETESWLLQAQTDFGTAQDTRAAEWVADNDTRADEFTAAQTSRTNTFNDSEAARTSTFNTNETGRSNTFTTNENARQAAAEAGEVARDASYATAEANRDSQFDANESARSVAETERIAGENARAAAESARVTEYAALASDLTDTLAAADANIENFDVALQTGIIGENIAAELQNLEATYAPDIVAVKQQLEQTVLVADVAAQKADAMASGSPKGIYATLALLQAAYPTGTTGAYLVTADGKWYYWSGGAWTIGGTYQSTGIADGAINPKNINKTFLDQLTVPIYQPLFAQVDGTLQYGSDTYGAIAANAAETPKKYLVNTNKLDITIPATYIIDTALTNINYLLSCYNASDVFTGYISWAALNLDNSITSPTDGTKYVRVTLKKTDATQFVDGDNIVIKTQLNTPTEVIVTPPVLNLPYKTVDINGNGDYTSVITAVASEPEGTVIYVMPGVYIGTVRSFTKRIILIGTDKNKCIIKSQVGTYDSPAIEASCGYLQNLTILSEYVNGISAEIPDGTNGSYAFHCENVYGEGKSLEFDNCVIQSDFFAAVGAGLQKDFTLSFNNCELINNQIAGRGNYIASGTLGGLYFHDSNVNVGSQHFKAKDTIFRSNFGTALCILDLARAGTSVDCEFINCTLYSATNKLTNNIFWRGVEVAFGYNFSLGDISHGNTNAQLNA